MMVEFFNQIGTWFTTNLNTILATLGIGGASGGFLLTATTYLKSKVNSIRTDTSKEVVSLKEDMNELKEQNQLLVEYIKTDAEQKSQSKVLTDEVKYKYTELSNKANQMQTTFLDKVKSTVKETIDKY